MESKGILIHPAHKPIQKHMTQMLGKVPFQLKLCKTRSLDIAVY